MMSPVSQARQALVTLVPPQDLPEPERDPAEVRDLADEILSRSEYQDPEPPAFLERVGEWIGELLDDLFGGAAGGGGGGGGVGSLISWVLLAILIGVVAFFVVRVLARWQKGPTKLKTKEPVVLATDEGRSAKDWLKVAEDHEAAGRWREGVLCRYRALVLELCDRGLIADVAGRTAGEYVQEVADSQHPGVASGFTPATSLFEEVWYGGDDTGPEGRDRFRDLADATLQGVGK